jgi:hypothetical protein
MTPEEVEAVIELVQAQTAYEVSRQDADAETCFDEARVINAERSLRALAQAQAVSLEMLRHGTDQSRALPFIIGIECPTTRGDVAEKTLEGKDGR